jgi:predicted  nucleic acid-binding Zn-ribbon protein
MRASANRIESRDRLKAAVDELERERRRTTDELEALHAFEDQIRGISLEQSGVEGQQSVPVATTVSKTATGLQRVREAYESTLMSVPHYIEEYDDTYAESLAGEFSPEIAAALTDGTEFHGRCKRALLSAISNTQSSRELLLEAIDRERDSVREARTEIQSLIEECEELESVNLEEASFGALEAYRARFDALSDTCSTLSERRQDAIFNQRRIQRLPTDVPDVTLYFYQDLDVNYPVMSFIAELLDLISALRQQVDRELIHDRT